MEGLSLVTLEDQIANMGNATQRLPPAENSANRDPEEIIHKDVLSLDIWALIFEEVQFQSPLAAIFLPNSADLVKAQYHHR